MKIIIFGGFLGAGKTTLILQLAAYLAGRDSGHMSNVVILENEVGQVSIDDKVLKNGGFKVSTMFSGCVCCTTAGELVTNVHHIREQLKPDWLIIEATGVAYPKKIKENLTEAFPQMEECRIFCVADAGRWFRIKRAMGAFVKAQLEDADAIFINKIDKTDGVAVEAIKASIREIEPAGSILTISALNPIGDTVWKRLSGA